MSEFERFISDLVEKRFRTASALAGAIGMTVSAFTRGVKQGTLGVENCLRLAKAAEEPPSDVLRRADKADVAALIEELYGRATITSAERELLSDWSLLDPEERKAFRLLIQGRVSDRRRKRA